VADGFQRQEGEPLARARFTKFVRNNEWISARNRRIHRGSVYWVWRIRPTASLRIRYAMPLGLLELSCRDVILLLRALSQPTRRSPC
jgi:hypothetical protein